MKVVIEVDSRSLEKFINLLHNFNAAKNAGDPDQKAVFVKILEDKKTGV